VRSHQQLTCQNARRKPQAPGLEQPDGADWTPAAESVTPTPTVRLQHSDNPRPTSLLCAGLLAALLVSGSNGCGAGGGTERLLTPGPQTSAPNSGKILYVALAHSDRIVALHLGQDGLLTDQPFSEITVKRPRSLLVANGILYAALNDEVVSITLGDDGSLPSTITSRTGPNLGSKPTEMILRNDVLYVATEGVEALMAYRLQSGHVTEEILSSGRLSNSNYRTITLDDQHDIIYAGTRLSAQIDAYLINVDGSTPSDPILQLVETDIFGVEDLLISDGVLYAIESDRARINSYVLKPSGLLPDEPDSFTDDVERYADLLINNGRVYASAFNRGRIDTYLLEADGSLPIGDPASATQEDTGSFPTEMILDSGVLYVAQAGLDRVDAYVLGADGTPPQFPSSSTLPLLGDPSAASSFPNALALWTTTAAVTVSTLE